MPTPRSEFLRVRVSPAEKVQMERDARANERSVSQQVRFLLNQAKALRQSEQRTEVAV